MTTNHKTFKPGLPLTLFTLFCCIQTTTTRAIMIPWATFSCSKISPEFCCHFLMAEHGSAVIRPYLHDLPRSLAFCISYIRENYIKELCAGNMLSGGAALVFTATRRFRLMQSSSRKSKQNRCKGVLISRSWSALPIMHFSVVS